MSDPRERIANKIAAWVTMTYAVETYANDTHALADAVLDALGLEQVGWTVPALDDIALMDGEGCDVGVYWTVPVYIMRPTDTEGEK